MNKKWAPIAADTRIDHYFREVTGIVDGLDYLDLGFRIEKVFGVRISNDDWAFLSGGRLCKTIDEWDVKYAPMFSFGRLAELIAHRSKLGAIEAITILGSTSLSAGAFRAIERAAKHIDPKLGSIAPSTNVIERFRGRRLNKFWGTLRVLSANKVPPLPRGPLTRVLDVLFDGLTGAFLCLVIYALLVWGVLTLMWPLMSNAVMWGFVLVGTMFLLRLAGRLLLLFEERFRPDGSILPLGIETFRDLAELISGDRGGWCEKCGYDLTGLTSPRCPECGADVRPPITIATAAGAQSLATRSRPE